MKSKISITKCKDYSPQLVQDSVRRALDLLGGIDKYIKPNSRVLVKPNLLMAKEPEFCIDTHPEIVRAAVKLLKEINCTVFIGDGPSVWGTHSENVDDVYKRSGIKKVADEEHIELVKFDKKRWRKKFPLTTWLDDCDYIVNLPKFKTHDLTILTGGVKNLFGLVWSTYKTELHKNYFNVEEFAKIIVDIYEEVKPTLTIVDAVFALEGDGPGTRGRPRETGLVIAGSDCVAIDSILSMIMGLKPEDILTTREAAKRGLGAADLASIEILGEKIENITGKPFVLPTTSIKRNLPKPVVELAKKLIKYYPCVEEDNCIKCAGCIEACPNKIIKMKNGKINFDYSKCIACFCCQEACPASAIKVKKSFFAKLIGL